VRVRCILTVALGGSIADGDGEAEAVFETAEDGWYVYDFATHTLSPSPLAYVVKTHDEQFYALRFESYYDDAGSSGHPSFLHRSVNGPEVFR
ncbi:MAG: HmuY family protein, partial [Myxococcota bacterium]